jgi:hypothetical protein
MLALQSVGYSVLLPFGENTRYDLVIDDGEVLERVQCKTGRLRGGVVEFATTSTYGHHRNPATHRRNYKGQVDYFAVYCPDNGGVYLMPADDLPNESQAYLRIDPPRNNQFKRIRFARDYEIATLPCVDPTRAPPRRRQLPIVSRQVAS